MRRYITYIIIALIFVSCEHKELCYQHPHIATITVEFDWKNAPEATPEGMCLFFYAQDSRQVYRYDLSGKEGGKIDIAVGKYSLICYNNDTESVMFRNMNTYYTHEAYTREGGIFENIYGTSAYAPRSKGAEEERVKICPDMMWGCTEYNVEIKESGISYSYTKEEDRNKVTTEYEQVITLYPSALIATYTYEVRNVKNLKNATQICGSLSSMAGCMKFVDEELGTECVTIPFEAYSDGVSTITGKFYTFGHHEQNERPHHMLLYFWIKNMPKGYYYTFDVTDQIHNAPDKRHVHIIIDGPELPQVIENGSGFHPSVDGWENVESDLKM